MAKFWFQWVSSMDQLSSLTNNYSDVQTFYYLTSSSIPTTIGKQYNTNADGQIGWIFFSGESIFSGKMWLGEGTHYSFSCTLKKIHLSTLACHAFGKKILSDRIYVLDPLYVIFSSVAPGTGSARTGNISNPWRSSNSYKYALKKERGTPFFFFKTGTSLLRLGVYGSTKEVRNPPYIFKWTQTYNDAIIIHILQDGPSQ